jgi:hypothetical protein
VTVRVDQHVRDQVDQPVVLLAQPARQQLFRLAVSQRLGNGLTPPCRDPTGIRGRRPTACGNHRLPGAISLRPGKLLIRSRDLP